jgi:predicted RNase H-like HicB family nuclease
MAIAGDSMVVMKRTLSFVVFEEDGAFVVRCLDVDVASEGLTRDEAIANLREALELHFEDGTDDLATLPTRTYQFGEVAIEA